MGNRPVHFALSLNDYSMIKTVSSVLSSSRKRSREFMKRLILLTTASLILGMAGSLFAQGVQTGTIRGLVKDQQDLAVPGVTVTATSPALQGPRSTVTDKEGLYVFRALPPGDYQVNFELSGFVTLMRNIV